MNKVADFEHIYFGRFSVQNIVIFIIFGIIGVLCIYNLTVGKKHRAKGFVGKFILSDANEMKAYIEGGE